jgi:hypothetical protein
MIGLEIVTGMPEVVEGRERTKWAFVLVYDSREAGGHVQPTPPQVVLNPRCTWSPYIRINTIPSAEARKYLLSVLISGYELP